MLLPVKNIFMISMIHRKFNIWIKEKAAPFSFTSSQVSIILLICDEPGISQSKVVESLFLEKSVVAKSIRKLMENNYIIQEQNSSDKRSFNLFPTQKALDAYPTLLQYILDCMDHLTLGLNNEEQETLTILLEKLITNTLS